MIIIKDIYIYVLRKVPSESQAVLALGERLDVLDDQPLEGLGQRLAHIGLHKLNAMSIINNILNFIHIFIYNNS